MNIFLLTEYLTLYTRVVYMIDYNPVTHHITDSLSEYRNENDIPNDHSPYVNNTILVYDKTTLKSIKSINHAECNVASPESYFGILCYNI